MGEPLDRSQTSNFNIPANSSRLPALDGLRAIAILSVLAYHFGFEWVPADLGVSLFFVLSGFLVTRGFLDEYDRTGTVDAKAFHRRRALRIFPAYYAFLGIVYLEEWIRGYHWDPWLIISGITHTVNYYNAYWGHSDKGISHLWALSLLEQFYIGWPYLFRYLISKPRQRVVWVLVLIILAAMSWRSVAASLLQAPPAYLYNSLETRIDGVCMGALAAIYFRGQTVRGLAGWVVVPPTAILATLLLLIISRTWGSTAYHYSLGFTLESSLLAFIMLLVLVQHQSWFLAWLDLSLVRQISNVSYPIYLWHLVCFGLVNRLVNVTTIPRFILALVFCLGVGAASYAVIERPFLRLKRGTRMETAKGA